MVIVLSVDSQRSINYLAWVNSLIKCRKIEAYEKGAFNKSRQN